MMQLRPSGVLLTVHLQALPGPSNVFFRLALLLGVPRRYYIRGSICELKTQSLEPDITNKDNYE